MATTLDPRPTLPITPIARPTEPTTTRGVSSTSGTLPSTTPPGAPSPPSTTSTTSRSTSTTRSTTRTPRPPPTFSISSSSTDASLSSSSSPTPALPSDTTSIDPVPSGTLVIPLPNPSQDSNTAAGTPPSRPKASTQNIIIAVVSAAALIGLAAVLYFSIRACVRRRQARQLPVHTGVRASMVHRHSSNDSRAALWAALGAGAAAGRSNESVGPSTAHGHGGTDATYGGPVPVTRGTLRGGPGHRRHTSLLTDTPDDPPLPLANDPTTPQWPFIAMSNVPTQESSQHQHRYQHQPNMVYVPWAGTAAPLSMRPFSMSRSPPPPPGAMVIPPGFSGVSLHRGTHYASESSLGHSQAHTELLQALDWGGATRMSTAGDHSHDYDHDHDQDQDQDQDQDHGHEHEHDEEELVPPPPVLTSAHRRHDSIEPQTIGAWIAGAGGSTVSLAVRDDSPLGAAR